MPSLPVNRIKKKNILSYNGELCIVLECLIRTPPNNASYCQMELRSIKTGAKIPVRCGINVAFEVFDNSIKQLELS
jgi:translation elongation factor P/translation initiation factor 5A